MQSLLFQEKLLNPKNLGDIWLRKVEPSIERLYTLAGALI